MSLLLQVFYKPNTQMLLGDAKVRQQCKITMPAQQAVLLCIVEGCLPRDGAACPACLMCPHGCWLVGFPSAPYVRGCSAAAGACVLLFFHLLCPLQAVCDQLKSKVFEALGGH